MRASTLRLASFLLVSLAAAPALARPDEAGDGGLYHFDASETVEHLDTARFRVFYTRAGKDSVPTADANSDGIPDHVAEVAQLYEDVLAFYTSRGYKAPLADTAQSHNGGDGRFDVYLLDFGGSADGHFVQEVCQDSRCTGYMVQENDFAGYGYPSATIGNRVLASHEFFHAVQAAYDADQNGVLAEGTAVWSTEQFDPSLTDFEGFISGYFSQSDRTLNLPGTGPVDSFSYGAAIFFQFLGEKLGVDVIRKLYEDCVLGARGVANPDWLTALAALLTREYATSFAETFTEFATWNLFTGNRADPSRGYKNGATYVGVKTDKEALPYEDTTMRVFRSSAQLLSFDPAGRTAIVVQVLPLASAMVDSLTSLRVIAAPVIGGKIGTLTTVSALDPASPIDVTGAGPVLIELVNTAQTGESVQGTLCIGDATEVAACVQKNGPMTMPPPAMASAGCEIVAAGPSPMDPGVLALVMMVFVAARVSLARRRRAVAPR